jgi:hypothetical protein
MKDHCDVCADVNSKKNIVNPASHTKEWLDLGDPSNQVNHVEEKFWDNFGSSGNQTGTTGEI